MRSRGFVPALVVLGVVVLAACGSGGPAYFLRAGWSEARILFRRQPITELLARPDLDADLRERLVLTLAVREFAAGPLALRVGDSYTTYADVDGDATVWVLSAARRDRLEAHTWRYPIVGRLPYRGFFERADAETAGQRLAAHDLDVEVRPAVAFSTLGYFADPLLSTVTAAPPVGVAETVLHELFHATLYVPGAAEFNESAANFAGHRGAIAFFCSGPGTDGARCAEAQRRWTAVRRRARVLERLGDRLRRVYAGHPSRAVRERARRRLARAAGAALTRRGLGGADELVPPNNARLLGELLYGTQLDVFDRLAPTDADLGPALSELTRAVQAGDEPFAALHALAARGEGGYSSGRDG